MQFLPGIFLLLTELYQRQIKFHMRQVVLIVVDRAPSRHCNYRQQRLLSLIIEVLHSDRFIKAKSLVIDDVRSHVYFKFANLVGDD